MKNGLIFEEELKDYSYRTTRGTLVILATADLHFAAFDPELQYKLLYEQQLAYARSLPRLDIFAINGDIFDHKVTTTSKAAMYAEMYILEVIKICKEKDATLVIIHGTYTHDASQLNLFMQYLNDSVDIRIVNDIRFEIIKGARCLCMPELCGIDESFYQEILCSEEYDLCFMHGTIKGASYANENAKLFQIEDFNLCKGPILSGHVHTSGCFNKYFYYSGSPYRWAFGEEEPKGFLMALVNLDTGYHYIEFQEMKCQTYITIQLDTILESDPAEMINHINEIKESRNIDYIRVQFSNKILGSSEAIINNYYRENKNVKIVYAEEEPIILAKDNEQILQNQFSYLTDDQLSPEEKFVNYVNDMEGCVYITLDQLLNFLKEDI